MLFIANIDIIMVLNFNIIFYYIVLIWRHYDLIGKEVLVKPLILIHNINDIHGIVVPWSREPLLAKECLDWQLLVLPLSGALAQAGILLERVE